MLRALDGFDYCDYKGSALKYLYAASSDQGAIIPGNGPGRAWWIFNTGFGEAFYNKVLDPQAFWCMGMDWSYQNQGGLGDNTPPVVRWYRIGNLAGSVLELRTRADFRLDIVAGTLCTSPGLILDTTRDAFPLNTWGFLEFKATFGATVGYELWYGGSILKRSDGSDLTASGLGLGTVAIPDRLSLYWKAFGNKGVAVDNYYILDGQPGLSDRLGPCRITSLQPAVDDVIDWTRNAIGSKFVAVADNNAVSPFPIAPDGDTSYIAPNFDNARALFGLEKSPCYGLVRGIAINMCSRPTLGSASIQGVVRDKGVLYDIDVTKPVNPVGHYFNHPGQTDNYFVQQAIAELSPVTGSEWLDSELSNGLWGCRGSLNQRLTALYLEKLVDLAGKPFTCGQSSYSY